MFKLFLNGHDVTLARGRFALFSILRFSDTQGRLSQQKYLKYLQATYVTEAKIMRWNKKIPIVVCTKRKRMTVPSKPAFIGRSRIVVLCIALIVLFDLFPWLCSCMLIVCIHSVVTRHLSIYQFHNAPY